MHIRARDRKRSLLLFRADPQVDLLSPHLHCLLEDRAQKTLLLAAPVRL